MKWHYLGALVSVGLALAGCDSDSGCDDKTVDRAVAFLDAHQSCKTNEDCVTVSDHCGAIPGGFCGQLAMSREGAESTEWQKLDGAVNACAPTSCVVCDAALVPTCRAGLCSDR